MVKTYNFKARGVVLGRTWMFNKGFYPTVILRGDTIEEIEKEAKERLKDGSLDAGYGFESLIGAVLLVEEIITVVIKGEEFKKSNYNTIELGELTGEQMDKALEVLYVEGID